MLARLKDWAKRGESPLAQRVWRLAKALRGGALPVVPVLHRPLYALHLATRHLAADLARTLYWTPLFQPRLEVPAPNLYLHGGMPQVLGPLRLRFGTDCRVSAQSIFSGRPAGADPMLIVGRNVAIGAQTTVAVGHRVTIGDNVRIAGRTLLAGYPGHPQDAGARAAGLPDTDDQVGDIVLEDGVSLSIGVTVSAGVTIGRGTMVAAGSVVTKDLPAFVLAAGVPAKVVRSLAESP